MPSLRLCLQVLPHRDVRGIATRLRVRQRGAHRKADWVAGIVQVWQDAGHQAQIIASLSPAARLAAGRLAAGGEFPAPLFLAEYGAVRRPRPHEHWRPPPWDTPQTVSEELYYCGLLAAVPAAALERAVRVTLPADLQTLFLIAEPTGQPAAPLAATGAASGLLLHDVAQMLCFLAEHPGLTLLQGRWLAPAALADLNGRLLRPEPAPLPRSHARARRPRFIFFLATAAGLCADGDLTPRGWAWLAEPAPVRLTQLWNAWRTAPLALRRAYRQATAALPEPWPELALKQLANLPAAFTAPQLAQAVLGQEPTLAAYFTAHLPDIAALDAAAAGLLETLTADWGALTPAAPAEAVKLFSLTAQGRWLIGPGRDDFPGLTQMQDADPAAWLDAQADAGWRLTVSPWAPPVYLAHLAAYARHLDLPPAPPSVPLTGSGQGARGVGVYHFYHLNEATVAAAAAAGHGLPILLAALAGLGVPLSPAQLATLQAWLARGQELQLLTLPLLRAAGPELLARLLTHADVRAGLGELLSPTLAVITLPPVDLAARLRIAGFFPQGPGARDQGADARSQTAGSKALDGASDSPFVIRHSSSLAALWLAGQLYAALGEHTTLPLPPPFADLTALLAALPPLDQAVVQAQWETLCADWQALLDGRTFAPPPEPSDPAHWRPLIESALAAGRTLTLRYFTAGRNVLTQRTVTPYWIEEHRGIPYLRADCHLAGKVLLFRLDRIVELAEG